MNIAVIFAGGMGTRMNTSDKTPKRFLEVCGKPIIVHTIEIFQNTSEIDAIVVSCIEDWIPHMKNLKEKYHLSKIKDIVPGGETGQMSIFHGLEAAEKIAGKDKKAIVLIHDGVRPVIDEDLILRNIENVKQHGSAITSSEAKETFVLVDDAGEVKQIPSRAHSKIAKAPQSFYLEDILKIQRLAIYEGVTDAIDSCTLMSMYHRPLSVVMGGYDNIKITTPDDYYMFTALYKSRQKKV